MKKSLLLWVAALLLPMALTAQSELLTFNGAHVLRSVDSRHDAASRVELPANQKIMGHYTSDSLSTTGYGLQSAGLMPIATMLEPDELDVFQGGKIVAFRVGLADSAEVARVFVIPVTSNGKYGTRTDWTCSVNSIGWNTITLETPYEINLASDESLLIGFYFRQESGATPLSLVQVGKPYDSYTYRRVGSSGKWRELGFTSYGNLSVQCIVEKDDYPDYSITSYGLRSNEYARIGSGLPFTLQVKNKGNKQVEAGALTLSVAIDGKQVTTVTNEDAFFDDYYTLEGVAPTDGLSSGDHVMSIQPIAINGEPLEDQPSYEYTFKAYKRDFPRQKHVVEQLTSTYCTYCPLGNSMLSLLTQQRDDIIWVGIHGNLGNGVDPFRSNQGDSLLINLTGGLVSYPSGAFDRSTGWNDDVNIVNSLGYYEQYHQEVADMLGYFFDYLTEATPTFVEIKGYARYEESTRTATVNIHGDISPDFGLMLGDDAKLTVYIVEDSLKANQVDNGEWRIGYNHNGVFRKALGSVMGIPLNIVENGKYKNVFRFTVPSSWKWNNLHAVAFISRPLSNAASGFTDLVINNAETFKFEQAAGVEELVTDENAVPVEYYDIMGRQHDSLEPGINIVKMSDGSARKIMVK